MNQDPNPYAPPKDFGILPGAAPQAGVAPQGFQTGEVLRAAWEVFKKQWPVLMAALVLAAVPGGMMSAIPSFALLLRLVEPNSLEYFVVYAGSTVVSMVVGAFFQVGYVRIVLDAARGKTPDFMAILSGFDRFFPVLATNLLLYLALFFGFLLLLVPGVILTLGFSLCSFYCVDARLGPIAALGESWRAMRGHKSAMLVYFLAAILVYLVGLLACCVGALPASVVLYVGWAIIYIRVSGNAEAPFPRGT
jgi:hypothetical protein